MKVALLVMKERRAILDRLYQETQKNLQDCDVFGLTSGEQKNLATFLNSINYRQYERIVIFSRLKKLEKQLPVLQCIKGLIFIEYDACQNYMSQSKYRGRYSAFYKKLPWCRVISSGFSVAEKLVNEGIDAVYVGKGYDEQQLANRGGERDIDVGFLGSLKGTCYVDRKKMLETISARENVLVARTQSGEDYVNTLNRIKIFISADIGMGEYMAKNFEAMACGCVLLANNQGEKENRALGFDDGVNAVFYETADEAIEKISWLKNSPAVAKTIADNGQKLAEQNFTFENIGRQTAEAISRPMRDAAPIGIWQRLWASLRYGLKV